jgi:predicted ATPase
VIFETVGDAVYAAFSTPAHSASAALDAHRMLAADPWPEVGGRLACRISIHTGAVERRGSHYFGAPLFRAARLQALAYGEQTVVSAATAALVSGSLPDGAQLIDRGVHRLKDLQEPEHVYELQHPDLRTEFPPLKSLDARPNNLPIQLSSFVGRDEELTQVGALVRDHRLVTLLGPGGIGKTRLALQVAADQIDQFPEGAWFVDLSSTNEAGAIPDAIAAALRVPERVDQPALQTLGEHLRNRKLLLVLDNLEQLMPRAAGVVAELLSSAADMQVLATSRAPLRIRGEIEHAVPAMTAGDPHMTDPVLPSAIALFLARAREIQPELAVTDNTGPLIASICNRLDGLPLAIELAASRLRFFPLAALAQKLQNRLPVLIGGARDLPERQQTLRATIAWSDELLGEPDRELFHRLGVFAGSFGLDGASAIAGPGTDVEGGLTTLLEQSLIRRVESPDEPRFAMLETIREFAVDALPVQEREAAADRMADYVCTRASRSPDDLLGKRQAATLRLMDAELPNIRATLAWLQDQGDNDRLPLLVADLARYWSMRGLSREAQRWIDAAIPLVADQESNLRGHLYRSEAMMVMADNIPRARDAVERAIAIHRARGDTKDLAGCLLTLSLLGNVLHDYELTKAAGTEAAALAREIGDLRTEGAAVGNIAQTELLQGRIDEAEAGFRKTGALMREAGDLHGYALTVDAYAQIARARGDVHEAAKLHAECAVASADLGDPELEAMARLNLAMVLSQLDEWRAATPELLRGLWLGQEVGDLELRLTAVSIGASVLHAAGDPSGAALLWAMSKTISVDREMQINPLDRDDAAFAKVRGELGSDYADIERRALDVTLEEGTAEVASRLRLLIDSSPAS